MVHNKVEEVRAYFIKEYGEPKETMMGSFKYKYVNASLDSFNRLIDIFLTLIEKINFVEYEKQLNLVCEYCKYENTENMDRITIKLQGVLRDLNKGVNFGRSAFLNLLKDLGTVAENPEFNPNLVSNYFKFYLKVKLVDFNTKVNKRSVDKLGDPFWGRDKGLDNKKV